MILNILIKKFKKWKEKIKILKKEILIHLINLVYFKKTTAGIQRSDYKNINLLKNYITDNGKILSSKITSVSFGKQRKLTKEIKKAKVLGLL